MNYNKNDLMDEMLVRYYATFAHTLDTSDFVPEKFNDRILKYIFKNMKKKFKEVDRTDRKYQAELRRKERIKARKRKNKQKAKKRLERKQRRLAMRNAKRNKR